MTMNEKWGVPQLVIAIGNVFIEQDSERDFVIGVGDLVSLHISSVKRRNLRMIRNGRPNI